MKRFLAALGVGVVLALGVGVVLPPQAAQASISPLAPDPLNILPSVIKAGVQGGGGTIAAGNAMLLAMLQKAMKDKQFWQIVNASKAGTATVTEASWLASQLGKIKVPAFKPQTLAKGAGAAGAVLFSFDLGWTIGDAGLQALGIDKEGLVCEAARNTGDWLGVVGGVDCDNFKKNDELIANQGLVPGLTGGISCNASGRCIKLEKQGKNITYSGTVYVSYCFSMTGGMETNAGRMKTQNIVPLQIMALGGSDYGDYPALCSLPRNSVNQLYLLYEQTAGALIQYQIGNNPTGAPQIPEAKDMNPSRTFKCVVLGSNGVSYTGTTLPFKETDPIIPQPNCPELPAGVFPEHIKITEEGGGETHIIYEQDATPESKGWNATYPECADGTCMLDLLKNGKSCFQSPAACLEWFEDPNKSSTYQCRYGGKVVALSECNVYAPSFNGDPKVIGHPDTGQPTGNPKPDAKDPKIFTNGVQDPNKMRHCYPQGWAALNPLEWVFRPIQCAFEWAFVPRTTSITALNNAMKSSVETSLLGDVPAMVAAFTTPFEQGSGNCVGPPFRIRMDLPGGGMDETYYPLNSCTGVMSTLAMFSYAASGGVVLLGAALASIRYFAGIFGFTAFAYGATEKSSGGSKVQFKGGD